MTQPTSVTPTSVTQDMLDSWADDLHGPVALHMKQRLVPVEGEGAVVFPPTYADIGYSIDALSDGTKVAQIDSVGAQANRMEPLFKKTPTDRPSNPLAALVPQIEIVLGNDKTVSILDAGHRLGDALVRSSELADDAAAAFAAYQERGDAGPIAKLAPTSIVFGVWDSRGGHAKLPRIVQSVIRAWDVDVLHRAAQYNPPIDYVAEGELDEAGDKSESDSRSELGFRHAPAIWRDDGRKERVLGGIVARDGIWRDVTVNLIALRALNGEHGSALRRYVLGLTIVAATDPQDGFLRQGCLLTPDPGSPAVWHLVNRGGERSCIDLTADGAVAYAQDRAKLFGVGADRSVAFDRARARTAIDLKKGGKAKKRGSG